MCVCVDERITNINHQILACEFNAILQLTKVCMSIAFILTFQSVQTSESISEVIRHRKTHEIQSKQKHTRSFGLLAKSDKYLGLQISVIFVMNYQFSQFS